MAELQPLTVHVNVEGMVEGVVIRPGDTLIVRVDPGQFDDEAEAIDYRERLQRDLHHLLPDVRGVVMVVAGQIAVQRSPELDDPARPLVDLSPPPADLSPLPDAVSFDKAFGQRRTPADEYTRGIGQAGL